MVPNIQIFIPTDLVMPLLGIYLLKKIREANIDLCTDISFAMLLIILNEKKISLIAEKDLGIS